MTRVTGADAARWAQGFEEGLKRIGGRFGRAAPRRRVEAYLRGLLRRRSSARTAGSRRKPRAM